MQARKPGDRVVRTVGLRLDPRENFGTVIGLELEHRTSMPRRGVNRPLITRRTVVGYRVRFDAGFEQLVDPRDIASSRIRRTS